MTRTHWKRRASHGQVTRGRALGRHGSRCRAPGTVMGLRAGRRGAAGRTERELSQWNQRTRLMHLAQPSLTTHYVTERLVYDPFVQPTLVQLLPVHLPPRIQVIGTPCTSGRLLDEDFASFEFGNIRTSAAQITTRSESLDNCRTEPHGYIAVVIPGGVSGATPSDSYSI